jgi:signal transduction histidine kinase/HPt (histidine-containing phosphotransfer) domain-containing protein
MVSESIDDALHFEPESDESANELQPHRGGESLFPWKVLLVDDEPAVHEATQMSLRGLAFQGRPIELHSVYSANEACAFLGANDDVALILLDVVMEHDNAGFDVVEYVRRKLKDRIIRIVLRTGLPGEAPEQSIMVDYDIDDYREKTDLSHNRLITTVISGLRAYRNLRELKTLNEEMEQRVRQRTDELRLAKEAAEEANRAKSDFLAVISHELRTPLNSVIAMADLLVKARLDADSQDLASTIHDSGEVLLSIINDILDFSKLESGPIDLEAVPVKLNDLLEKVVSLLGPRLDGNAVELTYRLSDETPEVIQSDPTRLKQILLNLASNAVRFTNAGSVSIDIDYNPIIDELTLQVADTGVGIDNAKLEKIFEPFTQADTSTTRKYGGTGLGLAICKRLIDRMRGRISVHSVPGQGSRFEVSLPGQPCITQHAVVEKNLEGICVAVDCQSPAMASSLQGMLKRLGVCCLPDGDNRQTIDCWISDRPSPSTDPTATPWIRIIAYSDEKAHASELVLRRPIRRSRLLQALRDTQSRVPLDEQRPEHTQPPQLAKLRALVADDNPINRKVLQRILQTMRCEPVLVDGGLKAVAHLREKPVDILFLDLQMPDLDGFAVMEQLRAMPCCKDTKVVAVTASALGSERERCMAAGMDAFLTKPVTLADVLSGIQEVLPESCLLEHGAVGDQHAPANQNAAPLLDPATIVSLKQLQLLNEFVGEFACRVGDGLEQLMAMKHGADADEISRLAHQLKGASANIGAQALADALSCIEQQASIDEVCAERCRALFQASKQALEDLTSKGDHHASVDC